MVDWSEGRQPEADYSYEVGVKDGRRSVSGACQRGRKKQNLIREQVDELRQVGPVGVSASRANCPIRPAPKRIALDV